MTPSLFQCLVAPRTVALIGASGDAAKPPARPQRYLDAHGFKGRVIPVNPARKEVFGVPALANVREANEQIDHAFIMVPAKAVKSVVADCAEAGIPLATIFSDGFADIGPEGRVLQHEIVDIARDGGVRLIGPNSMGVISTRTGLAMTVNTVMDGVDLLTGSLALVSQSGSLIGTLLSRAQARGLGFSHLVAVGNEADLTVGEIVKALVDDPDTRAILLFLETLRGANGLASAARQAFDAGKPIIAYKLGQSKVGRDLAASHTGALVGPSENVSAFFAHNGIIEVHNFEGLFECAPFVLNRKPPKGRRVAVVTTTGGPAATVADQLGNRSVELVPTPKSLVKEMNDRGLHVSSGQIIDLTAAGTRADVYEAALSIISREGDCDAIVAIVGSSGLTNPQHAIGPIAAMRGGPPIAAYLVPEAPQTLSMFAEKGIAAFRTPEACADSVAAFIDWRGPAPLQDIQLPANVSARIAELPAGVCDEVRSVGIFTALGIVQPKSQILTSPGEDPEIAFPLVAKVLSPEIAHKTEAGAVALGIADRQSLVTRGQEIIDSAKRYRPDAPIEGLLVQEMHHGIAEVIIGFKRDVEVGPIVMLGLGGVLAEIYEDTSVRMAPVNSDTAIQMIHEVKGLAMIRGYRNLPQGDLDALAQAVMVVSNLAGQGGERILEAEINPLIVKSKGEGVVAVDGLIVCDR
ncbi:MAG: acetate--CoA ligase family protein [Alphaproteobacteria bacterium]|nr:acetate--CoA ligase family protein [Alphaproteobacteria bacterium]